MPTRRVELRARQMVPNGATAMRTATALERLLPDHVFVGTPSESLSTANQVTRPCSSSPLSKICATESSGADRLVERTPCKRAIEEIETEPAKQTTADWLSGIMNKFAR